ACNNDRTEGYSSGLLSCWRCSSSASVIRRSRRLLQTSVGWPFSWSLEALLLSLAHIDTAVSNPCHMLFHLPQPGQSHSPEPLNCQRANCALSLPPLHGICSLSLSCEMD
ncbi:hypothetical protein JOB18_042867, partial [Solea senegalensis]